MFAELVAQHCSWTCAAAKSCVWHLFLKQGFLFLKMHQNDGHIMKTAVPDSVDVWTLENHKGLRSLYIP